MIIRKSTLKDIDSILKLYDEAREFMRKNGNPNQWSDKYPEKTTIENDIKNKNSYVCVNNDKILGTFYFVVDNDPTYDKIYDGKWLNSEPYGVIHRIVSTKQRGVATFCLEWCFKKYNNIKIDTHKDNIPMQNLLKKNGYIKCGNIYLQNGDERIAFQKI